MEPGTKASASRLASRSAASIHGALDQLSTAAGRQDGAPGTSHGLARVRLPRAWGARARARDEGAEAEGARLRRRRGEAEREAERARTAARLWTGSASCALNDGHCRYKSRARAEPQVRGQRSRASRRSCAAASRSAQMPLAAEMNASLERAGPRRPCRARARDEGTRARARTKARGLLASVFGREPAIVI